MEPSSALVRHTYEEGLREGEIRAIKDVLRNHDNRLTSVESRTSTLERVGYTLLGAIALIQFVPSLRGFLG